jgi:hypothetical protein
MFTSTIGAPIAARTPTQPAAAYQSITVTPASPHIGAEVGQIDLTRPLTPQQEAEVKDAFVRYQVLFFRDQKISFDDHVRFASLFGPLGKHVGAQTISKPTDHPLVRRFHYDETSQRISGESWHSDQSCAPMPPGDFSPSCCWWEDRSRWATFWIQTGARRSGSPSACSSSPAGWPV